MAGKEQAEHRPLCVIPARGGSKRLARKNVAPLAGRPMLAWTVQAAVQSGVFAEVCVSTEDEQIAEVAREYGASTPFLRPAELAGDRVGVVDVCLHALDLYAQQGRPFTELGVLLATSPLRTAEDVQACYGTFCDARDNRGAEFCKAVTDYFYSPFRALSADPATGWLRPHWGMGGIGRTQDEPSVCVGSGAVYFVNAEAFRRERTFYGSTLVGHSLPAERSIDVDDAFGLRIAELLLRDRLAHTEAAHA